jgi:hypothetical protein
MMHMFEYIEDDMYLTRLIETQMADSDEIEAFNWVKLESDYLLFNGKGGR